MYIAYLLTLILLILQQKSKKCYGNKRAKDNLGYVVGPPGKACVHISSTVAPYSHPWEKQGTFILYAQEVISKFS